MGLKSWIAFQLMSPEIKRLKKLQEEQEQRKQCLEGLKAELSAFNDVYGEIEKIMPQNEAEPQQSPKGNDLMNLMSMMTGGGLSIGSTPKGNGNSPQENKVNCSDQAIINTIAQRTGSDPQTIEAAAKSMGIIK